MCIGIKERERKKTKGRYAETSLSKRHWSRERERERRYMERVRNFKKKCGRERER